MALNEYLGEYAKKFLPVNARDIDSENIKQAPKGVFNVDTIERVGISSYSDF